MLGSLSPSLYEINAVGLRPFFRFVCRDGTSKEIASILFGRQRMTCPLFEYSLKVPLSNQRTSQECKAFCCLDYPNHSHECNHLYRDVSCGFPPFQTNSRHQVEPELFKNLPSICGHCDSKTAVKVDPTFH